MRSLIALVLLGSAVLAEPSSVTNGFRPAEERTPAPGFALASETNTTVSLSRYKGRVVLLDFWATWCTGCKVEIPWYQEFQKKYARRGLTSIGVAMDEEGWAIVAPYLDAHPVSYPIVLGDSDVADRYAVAALPVTLLIDRNGKVAARHYGVVDKAGLDSEIRKLLKERPKPPKK